MTDPKTPRPAEEVAREMAHVYGDGDTKRVLFMLDGRQIYVDAPDPDGLLRVIARTITRAREEGAAAERERCAEILRGGRVEIDRYVAMVDDAKAVLGVEHSEPLVDACRRVAAERARQQPRDLAGRIRALIQECAGRCAAADRAAADCADDDVMESLDVANANAHVFRTLMNMNRAMRFSAEHWRARASGATHMSVASVYNQAADELEAIVRECAPEKR